MNARIQVKHLLPAWEAFRSATSIAPIRDAEHYQRMVSMLEALLDEAGGNENHPAMGLVDIVGDLIEDYESENHPLPDVTGVQALKFPKLCSCCHFGDESIGYAEAITAARWH